MKELLIKLKWILEQMETELGTLVARTMEHDILLEKIDDVKLAIEACQFADEDNALESLCELIRDTTCGALYKTVKDYYYSVDKVVYHDLQTNEYHTYSKMEDLAETLLVDACTNEWFSVPAFANDKEKEEFYQGIINEYEYELVELA